jgi:spore coat polysaccharide biosynthesis protein SpsF (cytidylyltransferase family)
MSARTVGIIQARMGSTRLPGKVMLPLFDGETPLSFQIRRLRRSRSIDLWVVATTELSRDDVIADHTAELGLPCVRGSESDVLDRYHRAAVEHGADPVVRITSDCPLHCPEVVDRVVETFFELGGAMPTRVDSETFAKGLGTEVVPRALLDGAWRNAREAYDREHVTPWVYKNHATHVMSDDEDTLGDVNVSLDTPQDRDRIVAVWERLGRRDDFTFDELKACLREFREPRAD